MPPFLIWVVTVVGGVLAINFGAVLGIDVIKKRSIFSISELPTAKFQKIAAYSYLIILLVVIVCWGILGFEDNPDKVVEILPQFSKTLIGVGLGALAVILGIES
jgi:hypothetical protein